MLLTIPLQCSYSMQKRRLIALNGNTCGYFWSTMGPTFIGMVKALYCSPTASVLTGFYKLLNCSEVLGRDVLFLLFVLFLLYFLLSPWDPLLRLSGKVQLHYYTPLIIFCCMRMKSCLSVKY